MKKIKILLLVLCIAVVFTGCSSFRIAASIDDLISPVSPSGDDAAVQNAVGEYCNSGYLIKIPSGGEYTTSYIYYDLNSDGIVNEAIAFYEPSDNLGTINMAVLNKHEHGWQVVYNIEGEGSDVYSLDFSDVNNDGVLEIIVCWGLISKSTSFNLCVYRQIDDNGYSLKEIDSSVTAGEFICADVNNDGINEVLVFKLGSSSVSPSACLYSYASDRRKLIGETKLDSTINSFSLISVCNTAEGTSVYADAIRNDGVSMVTEFIYWSDYYDSIVSPFYSYSTGRTTDTARNCMINSADINGDGIIEIPLDFSVSSLPSQITAQSWTAYENTVLKTKCYSVSCKRDSYCIILSRDYLESLKFDYDTDQRTLTVYNGKQKCFEILTVLKSAYNAADYSGYTEIFNNSGFIYLAKADENSDIDITVDDLKDMIKPY